MANLEGEVITLKELVAKVLELAETSPDNKYIMEDSSVGCLYTSGSCSNGAVGCIFGQALTALNPDLRGYLETVDNRDTGKNIDVVLRELKDNGELEMLNGAHMVVSACARLQNQQDSGKAWRDALEQGPWVKQTIMKFLNDTV